MARSPSPRPQRRVRPSRSVRAAVVLLSAVTLVGAAASCSRGTEADAETAAAAFDEPVTIDNCGRTETFDAPPQRIITMNGYVTETLIEMGAGDRIIGKAYPDAIEPQDDAAGQYRSIPLISKKYPTAEQVLDADPDLVVGGMSSAFDEKSGRGRDGLGENGINTFLFSEYCGDGLTGMDVLKRDFTQLGTLLGTPDQAQELIDRITDGLDGIRDRVTGDAPVRTFFYDSGEDQPFTVGGAGIGELISGYTGIDNITDDTDKPFFTGSWETVGERAPDAIVVLDYGDGNVEQKIDFLRNQPIMRTTPAVQNDRFVVVPLADMFESSRMVLAARTIARGLHPEAFVDEG